MHTFDVTGLEPAVRQLRAALEKRSPIVRDVHRRLYRQLLEEPLNGLDPGVRRSRLLIVPHGHPLSTVVFGETDLASIARGYGCEAVTVRHPGDLAPVAAWLAGPREVPMVVDAKVAAGRPSWWLEEAFRGH